MNPFALLPGVFQGAVGIAQALTGLSRQATQVRPEYKMPREIMANRTLAAQSYADPLSYAAALAMNNAALSQSNSLNAAITGGGGLGSTAAITAAAGQQYNQIAAQIEAQKFADRQALSAANQTVADYRDQEWQMNKFAPYVQRYQESRDLTGAGLQNMFGGIGNLSLLATAMNFGNNRRVAGAAASSAANSAANFAAGINSIAANANQTAFNGAMINAALKFLR